MFLALAIAAIAGPANGHGEHWTYDPWCCSGAAPDSADPMRGDCAPLPAGAVKVEADGWHVTILPGQHPMVRERAVRHVVPFTHAQLRPSGDERYHICLYPGPETVRCFYTPPMGF